MSRFRPKAYGPGSAERGFREIRSNGGSASARLCIGPYKAAGRMPVYRENSKEAEYAMAKQQGLTRVLNVSALRCGSFFLSRTSVCRRSRAQRVHKALGCT